MNATKFILYGAMTIVLSLLMMGCTENNNDSRMGKPISSAISKEDLENQAWQMEERYWEHVGKNDTSSYKNLWHDDFIGYPSFGDGVADNSKIAAWIPELHQDTSLIYSYQLHKKASNAIDDVVIVFYDVDQIWRDKENNVVLKETYKLTHTWKKYNNNWVILGGMSAKKKQDIRNN